MRHGIKIVNQVQADQKASERIKRPSLPSSIRQRNAVAGPPHEWQQCPMSSRPPLGQLFFNFPDPPPLDLGVPLLDSASTPAPPESGRDASLEQQARLWLDALGLHEGAIRLQVHWN